MLVYILIMLVWYLRMLLLVSRSEVVIVMIHIWVAGTNPCSHTTFWCIKDWVQSKLTKIG